MRVLITTDTVGGVWHYTLELCRAMETHGVEFSIAVMGKLDDDQKCAVESLRNAQVFNREFALEWMPDPWDDVDRAGQWLLDLEETAAPDIVHLNGFCHANLPWSAPVLSVAHSCVLSWFRAVRGCDAPPEWDTYRARVSSGLAAADALVAPTQGMLDQMRIHHHQLPPSQVIYNGRNPALYKPLAKDSMILCAGRLWDEAKNISAVQLASQAVPWPVYMAGDATAPAGEGALPLPTRTVGRLSQSMLAAFYGRASIYVSPALYEPFGLSVLEAALSECALVLSDIPTFRELWSDAAVFVPPTDTDQIISELEGLIHDHERRSEMAHQARVRAARYSSKAMAAGYFEVYRELLAPEESSGRESVA